MFCWKATFSSEKPEFSRVSVIPKERILASGITPLLSLQLSNVVSANAIINKFSIMQPILNFNLKKQKLCETKILEGFLLPDVVSIWCSPHWGHKLYSKNLVDPFQFRILYDSIISGCGWVEMFKKMCRERKADFNSVQLL